MARKVLTKEAIVAEALLLLDESGLEGLSMRKLATRLGVQAPTLYYHIPDKTALLNDVVLALFEQCFERMRPCSTWQDWMREFGRAIWDVQEEARYSPLLILTTNLDDAHVERTVELVRNQLARFDADQDQLFFIQSAVQAVITGWSVLTQSSRSRKMAQLFELREAALSSVDSLVAGWEQKIGPAQRG